VFAALAHEHRRHVLLTLWFRGGELTAGQIAARFACSWPTTTRHLKVLEAAGLVVVARRGRERVYRIDADRLRGVVLAWIDWFAPRAGDRSDDAMAEAAAVSAAAAVPAAPPRRSRR
jgi:DNA-binding transcriptional ArsR family regulator